MPLDVQLRALKQERRAQTAEMTRYEKQVYPTRTDIPVSELSVKVFGDAAWHSQPKNDQPAPSTYQAWQPRVDKWNKRRWDVDHMQFVREGLAPAHVFAREIAEGKRH